MFSEIDLESINNRLFDYKNTRKKISEKYGADCVPSNLNTAIEKCEQELYAAKIHNKCCESLNAWCIWFTAQIHWVEYEPRNSYTDRTFIYDGERGGVLCMFIFDASNMTLSVLIGNQTSWQHIRTATYNKTGGWTLEMIEPDPNIGSRRPVVWGSYEDEAAMMYLIKRLDDALEHLSELEGITCETTETSKAVTE